MLTDPIDLNPSETLGQVPLGTLPPVDGKPVILREGIQESANIPTRDPVLQAMGPSGSTPTPVRWRPFLTRVQFHLLGRTKPDSGGHSHHMGKHPLLQTLPEGGLVPITSVGQRR